MIITLNSGMFTNNVYSISYGLRKATFTIVDESYASGAAAVDINRMVCDIKTYDGTGAVVDEVFGSLVIGLGDENLAVTANDTALLGKTMTKDNMASCAVELYE